MMPSDIPVIVDLISLLETGSNLALVVMAIAIFKQERRIFVLENWRNTIIIGKERNTENV